MKIERTEASSSYFSQDHQNTTQVLDFDSHVATFNHNRSYLQNLLFLKWKLKKGVLFFSIRLCHISALFFLTSCGIYNGGFERGGELTSSFLERIQEKPKDQEDILLSSHQEKN